MDTKFWGPDAWNFLHSVAERCPAKMSQRRQLITHRFFNNLKHVLPCVFCRNSLKMFYEDLPIDTRSGKCTRYWFYRIHNRVNNKLRQQAGHLGKNPSARQVFNFYNGYSTTCIHNNNFPGWDFMYCMCINYTPAKYLYYKRFFTYLTDVLPYPFMKTNYRQYINRYPIKRYLANPTAILKWLYGFQTQCVSSTSPASALTFAQTRARYMRYRAVCINEKGVCSRKHARS